MHMNVKGHAATWTWACGQYGHGHVNIYVLCMHLYIHMHLHTHIQIRMHLHIRMQAVSEGIAGRGGCGRAKEGCIARDVRCEPGASR